MNDQEYPPGWDEKRVKELIAHYENQTEDEEFAEIEVAPPGGGHYPDGDPQRAGSRGPGAACSQAECLNVAANGFRRSSLSPVVPAGCVSEPSWNQGAVGPITRGADCVPRRSAKPGIAGHQERSQCRAAASSIVRAAPVARRGVNC